MERRLSPVLLAYSPELNPVERVWLYLKERFLSSRLLDDYEAIADAACNAWNRLLYSRGRPHEVAVTNLGSAASVACVQMRPPALPPPTNLSALFRVAARGPG